MVFDGYLFRFLHEIRLYVNHKNWCEEVLTASGQIHSKTKQNHEFGSFTMPFIIDNTFHFNCVDIKADQSHFYLNWIEFLCHFLIRLEKRMYESKDLQNLKREIFYQTM